METTCYNSFISTPFGNILNTISIKILEEDLDWYKGILSINPYLTIIYYDGTTISCENAILKIEKFLNKQIKPKIRISNLNCLNP